MEICGKCGREPWDGICNLLFEWSNIKGILEPAKNAQTRRNCGHPLIGESPLIIEAAERNKALICRQNIRAFDGNLDKQLKYYEDTATNHNQSSA